MTCNWYQFYISYECLVIVFDTSLYIYKVFNLYNVFIIAFIYLYMHTRTRDGVYNDILQRNKCVMTI